MDKPDPLACPVCDQIFDWTLVRGDWELDTEWWQDPAADDPKNGFTCSRICYLVRRELLQQRETERQEVLERRNAKVTMAIEKIKADIESGRYSDRSQLPAKSTLAVELGISHNMVKQALEALVDEGVIFLFRSGTSNSSYRLLTRRRT